MVFGRSSKTVLLQNVPLFQGLSRKQLERIGRLADDLDVPAGKRLAAAGEIGHELFVIIEGYATVRAGRGRTVRLGPGKFFGEMSLIDGGPRSASVEAATDMRLLVLGHREFWALMIAAPSLALIIMATLSRRVREAEAAISA
jgi:CRP/FNR family transcriptional regulator, cyclic AMP receptor protein